MPLVSILTPTYNHAAFLGSTIESVRAQSLVDWEMIVIDDGSTDGSAAIAEGFNDSRIKVIRQPHQGLTHLGQTYNRALAECSGELIAILEGDDYWPDYRLERQVPDFLDPLVALSFGETQMVDQLGNNMSDKPLHDTNERAKYNRPVGIAALELLNTRHLTYCFPVSTMIRRSVLERIGGFQQPPELPLVDLPTFLRVALEGEFRSHKDVFGYWRRHTESTTLSRLPAILDGVYAYAEQFLNAYGDQIPAEFNEVDALDNQWASFQAHRRVLVGRWLLAEGRKGEAKAMFRGSLRYRGGLKRKLKAWIGLWGTLGLPTEPLYRLAGMRPFREELALQSGDPTVSLAMAEWESSPRNLLSAWESAKKRQKTA